MRSPGRAAALRPDRRDASSASPCEIYPFLGSQLLGEAIDAAGADLVLHGHAHSGTEHGTTPGGVPVRNVALPVVCSAYRVFHLGVVSVAPCTHVEVG